MRTFPFLLLALAAMPAVAFAEAPSVPVDSLAGIWISDADPEGTITVFVSDDRVVGVRAGERFTATGYFDGREVVAVTRTGKSSGHRLGSLRIRPRNGRALDVDLVTDPKGSPVFKELWTRQGAWSGVHVGIPDSVMRDLPEFGEYVYVEELPEAISKVAPEYPDQARKEKVQGTVMVQALVGRDGLVKDTKVVNSIPGLDDAAVFAVRRWKFKPARAKGEPVAIWVAIPVKFTLK